MSADHAQTSSEVAHEAEDTRAHLASTLEQLRTNLKPENVMEEVVSNARVGASAVADNLADVAKSYPIPAILIAAGAAMIMGVASKGLGRSGSKSGTVTTRPSMLRNSRFDPAAPRTPRRITMTSGGTGFAGSVSSLRDGVKDYVSDQTSAVSGQVGVLKRQASDVYYSSSSKARDAMQNASRYIPHDRSEVKSKLSNLLEEQPLILGAIGLAVGAAIGAALPITQTEDNWMGSTAHSVRQAAQDAARQEVDTLRAAAGQAVENVKQSAADHGLSTENLNDLGRDVGTHAKSAVNQVGGSLDANKDHG